MPRQGRGGGAALTCHRSPRRRRWAARARRLRTSGASGGSIGPRAAASHVLLPLLTPSWPDTGRRVVEGKGQQLAVLALELFCNSRGALLPDPRFDQVRVMSLSVLHDKEDVEEGRYETLALIQDAKLFKAFGGGAEQQGGHGGAGGAAVEGTHQPPPFVTWKGGLPEHVTALVVENEKDLFG